VFSQIQDADCSCLQVEVLVSESWIDHFLRKQQLIVPVSEQYHLSNLKIDLAEGKLTIQADIVEKKGSAVRLTCLPKWEVEHQRLFLEELELKLISKNILLKSAGWFAKIFMGGKIDKKIEKTTNQLYTSQMEKILEDGLEVKIPDGSSVNVAVRSIAISEMIFVDHSIKVKAMIDGLWKLKLLVSSEQ
jgi:hypothetical protein